MSVVKMAEYHYMANFLQVYRELMGPDVRKKADLLLRPFMKGEGAAQMDAEMENAFLSACSQLMELHCESLILEFMVGVFLEPQVYDRETLYRCLKQIAVTDTKNLADWCADFFLGMDAQRRKIYLHDEREFHVDLYRDDYEAILELNVHSWADTAKWMAEYIYETKYNETFYLYEVEESLIDAVAARATTPYGVIGLLQPLYRALELSGYDELCYYILSRHVMNAFGKVEWRSDWIPRVRILAVLFCIYGQYFYSLTYKKDEKLSWRALKKEYTEEDYLREASGAADGYYMTKGKQLYQKFPGIAFGLTATLHAGADVLRRIMPEWLMSFLYAYTPYVQICTGKTEWVGRFLMEHLDEIRVEDRRRLYFQITLARVAFREQDLAIASGLCAQYDYEMDRASRRGPVMQNLLKKAVAFMEDAEAYLCDSAERSCNTGERWYDILYKNQSLQLMMERIQNNLNAGKEMAENDVWQLMNAVTAFSHEGGIHLGLLNLPRVDDYDKLPDALPNELTERGRKILDYREELEAYYLSRWDGPVRKSVSTILHDHVSNLINAKILESVDEIRKLKASCTASETDPGNERLLIQLDEICKKLNQSMELDRGGSRQEAEAVIHESRKKFIKEYAGKLRDDNVLTRVSPECGETVFNYLVTSEMVFRYLSEQEDVEQLDFSPALISLTKAMELVMNEIYNRMDPDCDYAIDTDLKKSIFDQYGEPKESLELGPCIFLLKDGKYVNVKKDRNAVNRYYVETARNAEYPIKHFRRWGGNDVIDISRLSDFVRIPIRADMYVYDKDKYVPVELRFRRNDNEYNRNVLIKGLEYIKDNYRNNAAHKDIIRMVSVEECRDLLIMTENLLWILLYIIRPKR